MGFFRRKIPDAVRSGSYTGDPNHFTHIIPAHIDLIVGNTAAHGHNILMKAFSHKGGNPAIVELTTFLSNDILPSNRVVRPDRSSWIYLKFLFHLPNGQFLCSNRICPSDYFIATDVVYAPWECSEGRLVNRFDIPKNIHSYYEENYLSEIKIVGTFPLNSYLKLCLGYEKSIYTEWPVEDVSKLHLPRIETSLDLLTSDYIHAQRFFRESNIN